MPILIGETMKKAAIIIDRWKLDIFERHLKEGGFEYVLYPGPAHNQLLIKAECRSISHINPIVCAANHEAACAKSRTLH